MDVFLLFSLLNIFYKYTSTNNANCLFINETFLRSTGKVYFAVAQIKKIRENDYFYNTQNNRPSQMQKNNIVRDCYLYEYINVHLRLPQCETLKSN